MDEIVAALAAQHGELADLLDGLVGPAWSAPTRCPGWDVSDVVLHLVQTDAMAVDSATGTFGGGGAGRIDEGAALLVAAGRGVPHDELRARWGTGARRLVEALDGMDLSTRVPWVAGELSARTLATTRLAETWIHGGDVAEAVGVRPVPTDRLRHIARLAWRTLPYAFDTAGRILSGPVAFRLTGTDGTHWDFGSDEEAVTVVVGPAADLCAVAARRVDPSTTALRAEGPDAADVLDLVRTYAV